MLTVSKGPSSTEIRLRRILAGVLAMSFALSLVSSLALAAVLPSDVPFGVTAFGVIELVVMVLAAYGVGTSAQWGVRMAALTGLLTFVGGLTLLADGVINTNLALGLFEMLAARSIGQTSRRTGLS